MNPGSNSPIYALRRLLENWQALVLAIEERRKTIRCHAFHWHDGNGEHPGSDDIIFDEACAMGNDIRKLWAFVAESMAEVQAHIDALNAGARDGQ